MSNDETFFYSLGSVSELGNSVKDESLKNSSRECLGEDSFER